MENFKNTNSRLTRWSLTLQPFKFSVEHRKGRLNASTDSLSRIGGPRTCFAQKKEKSVTDQTCRNQSELDNHMYLLLLSIVIISR